MFHLCTSICVDLFLFQVSGGRDSRPIGAYELAKAVEELGAGEILLNCIDCDGMLISFNLPVHSLGTINWVELLNVLFKPLKQYPQSSSYVSSTFDEVAYYLRLVINWVHQSQDSFPFLTYPCSSLLECS